MHVSCRPCAAQAMRTSRCSRSRPFLSKRRMRLTGAANALTSTSDRSCPRYRSRTSRTPPALRASRILASISASGKWCSVAMDATQSNCPGGNTHVATSATQKSMLGYSPTALWQCGSSPVTGPTPARGRRARPGVAQRHRCHSLRRAPLHNRVERAPVENRGSGCCGPTPRLRARRRGRNPPGS
jgi:hypothetical protein